MFISLVACDDTKTHDEKFLEVELEPLDETIDWLLENTNFQEENYYLIFDPYYKQQIEAQNYENAAMALSAVTTQENYYLFFRTETVALVREFEVVHSKKLSWDKCIFVDAYLGNYNLNLGSYRKGIEHFKKIVAHTPIDYFTCKEIAHAYSDMAFSYSAIGDQEKALKYNLKALEYFNKTNSTSGHGHVYDNIALVHMFTKNFKEADIYFDKAMVTYKLNHDTTNMFNTLHNKILMYQEMDTPKQYALIDSTFRFFNNSGLKDQSLELALSSFYIDKLLHENRIPEASSLLIRMEELSNNLDSPGAYADYQIALALYEIKIGKGMENSAVIEEALVALEEYEDYQNQIAFSQILIDDALLKGDFEKAFKFSEKLRIATNELANQKMVAKTLELNKKHQLERKEKRIVVQQKSIITKNAIISLLLLLLLTFSLVVIIIRSRQRQRKAKLDEQRSLLFTRQLMEKAEEDRKRIAGDLHDSVSHELLTLKNTFQNDTLAAGNKIDAIINDIRVISRNLHPIMFEKVGLAASLEQLVERMQDHHNLMVTAEIDYQSNLSISDELQIYRIVQEALSNIIKYANAIAAKIEVISNPEGISILIKDNGQGFNVEEKLNSTQAFGLHNILARSKAIGGRAKIHSDKHGTVITIEIKNA